MLSAVKFVHLWETNSGCTEEVETNACGYNTINYRLQTVVGNLNRQCTESLTKHSFVVCTSSSAQLDVVCMHELSFLYKLVW